MALVEQHRLAEERKDYRAAMICAVMANLWSAKGSRRYEPKDFIPTERKGQTPEEQLAIVKNYMRSIGDKG